MLADAAPFEPEKVQLVALFTSPGTGAGVISGPAKGEAAAKAAKARVEKEVKETILLAKGLGYWLIKADVWFLKFIQKEPRCLGFICLS